ncbi:MAG: fibro-slime domain-containing protein [Phycisphaerales bacterium]
MNRTTFFHTTATAFLVLGGVAGVNLISPASAAAQAIGGEDAPATVELTGIVRDFRERTGQDGYAGHPDFERKPNAGFGHYAGNVALELGADGNPVFTGNGKKLNTQFTDSGGNPICYALYNAAAGDVAGSWSSADTGGIQSAESFAMWFRDTPGMNMSQQLSLTFVRQADGSYVFDDKQDDAYKNMGGFFPIDGKMFGNPGGTPDHNFHFTFELHTEFTYHADRSQLFEFRGDDDVWVFIDNKLVIDIGGVHGAKSQFVDLHRLGLEDGENYQLSFFFAERHRTQSNFRIVTNLALANVQLPTISASFD